jgi:hypothetical protein
VVKIDKKNWQLANSKFSGDVRMSPLKSLKEKSGAGVNPWRGSLFSILRGNQLKGGQIKFACNLIETVWSQQQIC